MEGNKAAHGLAWYTQFVDDSVSWMEETPTIIDSEVISDVTQFSHSWYEIESLVSDDN